MTVKPPLGTRRRCAGAAGGVSHALGVPGGPPVRETRHDQGIRVDGASGVDQTMRLGNARHKVRTCRDGGPRWPMEKCMGLQSSLPLASGRRAGCRTTGRPRVSPASAPNVGMFDDFQGYRLPTEAEIDDALRLALIVIDANLLLNLYRYTESTRDDLLGVMGRLGDRLWVPHQVLREFWRNRLGVLTGRGSGTEQALAALAKQQRATADTLNQWAKMVAIEATDRDTLHAKVERTYAEVEDTIKAHAPSVPSVAYATSNEPVLRELEKLL